MKTMIRMLCLLCLFLFVFNLTGCSNSSDQLRDALAAYSNMIDQGIPDDLLLTIYYMDPFICTRIPLSANDLMQNSMTQKIVVHSEALKNNSSALKKLDWSLLSPVKAEYPMDARIHYVIEKENGEKLLEVTISRFKDIAILVNHIEVEENPVFYELIYPFLPEDARKLVERLVC